MSIIEMLTVAVALGTDAFSVAIVCGIQQFDLKNIIRISLVISGFHIVMPLTGIYGARFFQEILVDYFSVSNIENILNLIGSGLLLLIGFYMVIEKWLGREEELCHIQFRGWSMVVLAFSVSIDSLSVGISLGMLANTPEVVVLFIGITAGIMMATGLYFGSKIGHWLGEEAQIFGGLALIYLGLRFSGLLP